tara:strand:- start:22 stop:537 length:516 start_codon:yes stop_codon:yes gene_type:complete
MFSWPIDPNLSVIGQTYRQRYVDHDPLSDGCISRGRRHDNFIGISGLIEEIRRPSKEHNAILKKLRGVTDHASFYWYGNIPVVMVEPYGRQVYEFDGIEHLELPGASSPYGTCNGHETQSLLCVHAANKIVLEQIEKKIAVALPSLPDRYFVSEEERNNAEKQHFKSKGGK